MRSYHIIVIGAGAAGLVVANGAAKGGKRVLLIDKGPFGGDCTNFGCIPSKSLIASAKVAHSIKEGKDLGIDLNSSSFQALNSLKRVQNIVKEVRSHEDPAALQKKGVENITGIAEFLDRNTILVNGETIFGKQIVIATGTSPFIPPINGLENTPYLTNETIFDLTAIPSSLAVLGGGPIGSELAQAMQRLGAKVSLIHSHEELLNKEEREAQELIIKQFTQEGISLYLGKKTVNVSHAHGRFVLTLDDEEKIESEALLVSVGRRPNVSTLKLERAGVNYSEKGISVDKYGRTNVRHIWAVGDVTGPPFFTHYAENQARAVLKSLILPFKKKLDRKQPVPRVTFTDPEVASVGLLESEAAKNFHTATYVVPFSAVDRAVTESRTEGFIKIVTKKWSSQILGCTIVGPRAGEMLGQILTAMHGKIPLRKLASLIHPYPTYSGAIRRAADLWLLQTILPLFRRKR